MSKLVRYGLAAFVLAVIVGAGWFWLGGGASPSNPLEADTRAVAAALYNVVSSRRDVTRVEAALATAAEDRHLTEVVLFDKRGNVLARTGAGKSLTLGQASAAAVQLADRGEVVVVPSPDPSHMRALMRVEFEPGTPTYLFIDRPAP